MEPTKNQLIGFPTSEGFVVLSISEITYLESDANFSRVYTSEGVWHLITRQLKQLEQNLPNPIFFRAHRRYLVNKLFVINYNKKDSQLIMRGGGAIPVAVRKRKALAEAFGVVS